MKKYNKAEVILLIALCFLCLKTQCTEIQAAEKYKTINLAQQGKQKVGTTEFYANYSNETGRWNVYWKKGKKEGKFGSDQNVYSKYFYKRKNSILCCSDFRRLFNQHCMFSLSSCISKLKHGIRLFCNKASHNKEMVSEHNRYSDDI